MTLDHLVNHLTDPSTVRGIIWTIGATLALFWIHAEDYKGALEVLTQSAVAAGLVGALTRDQKAPCKDQKEPSDDGG